ncbi:uncharacterized protein TEOVI_000454300 [Trypanosoma equiperdum]|uniref:Uncharacterized protein n=2 Tax=Trypanozoon TaxID=39700 RepID=Q57UR5_TRYB2|nr:hypothetical protein, conserved [Trypanosoma brucei brucei TREU927]AAX70654.1 hypothetical protein, conserved [Trypanosoma brucei]AAZ12499.1 hypothetical protein, conserved [Trypanosoma brucei brucei TREU927]SCU72959.1 hypothetical protein, conserved [Trypanosoma equiperdum]
MNPSLSDSKFEKAMSKLQLLEDSRTILHRMLQHAHFSFSNAQRQMDRTGLLLAWEAVPTAAGAVKPQYCIVREMKDGGNGGDAGVGAAAISDDNVDCAVWKLVNCGDSAGEDPAKWFAVAPSEALRECQQHFRGVVNACVKVIQAQEEAITAAATVPVT